MSCGQGGVVLALATRDEMCIVWFPPKFETLKLFFDIYIFGISSCLGGLVSIVIAGSGSREALRVVGRRESSSHGLLHVGWFHALDGSCGAPVFCDALHPHVMLICGKRGYGKSHTIGVLVEELAGLELTAFRRCCCRHAWRLLDAGVSCWWARVWRGLWDWRPRLCTRRSGRAGSDAWRGRSPIFCSSR